jgi:hypothetical protein
MSKYSFRHCSPRARAFMPAHGLTPTCLPLNLRYSVYLLYWYKSANTDAALLASLSAYAGARGLRLHSLLRGTQFACFTGTTIEILTQKALRNRLLPISILAMQRWERVCAVNGFTPRPTSEPPASFVLIYMLRYVLALEHDFVAIQTLCFCVCTDGTSEHATFASSFICLSFILCRL